MYVDKTSSVRREEGYNDVINIVEKRELGNERKFARLEARRRIVGGDCCRCRRISSYLTIK